MYAELTFPVMSAFQDDSVFALNGFSHVLLQHKINRVNHRFLKFDTLSFVLPIIWADKNQIYLFSSNFRESTGNFSLIKCAVQEA